MPSIQSGNRSIGCSTQHCSPTTAAEQLAMETHQDVKTNLYASATTGCGRFALRAASFAFFFSLAFESLDLRSNLPRISIEVGLNGVPVESVARDPVSLSLRDICWLDKGSAPFCGGSGLGLDVPSIVESTGGPEGMFWLLLKSC